MKVMKNMKIPNPSWPAQKISDYVNYVLYVVLQRLLNAHVI
jgi:hypothetical protein